MSQFLDLNIKEILQDWSVSDALRELIANAYDEQKLSKTSKPTISYDHSKREVTIIDFGRGIKPHHFIQNEDKEKNQSEVVMGKFGIGLKDAISTLFRHGKQVVFYSQFGSFKPVEQLKQGLSDQTTTIHIEYTTNSHWNSGTKIIVSNVNETDFHQALSNFLESQPQVLLSSSSKGQIYKKAGIAAIYYNGMKISTDDQFIFSYNILSANTKLKKSLNRERKLLSRDAYREIVIAILKSCINKENQELINLILDKRDDYPNGEWSFLEVKKLIIENTNKALLLAAPDVQERYLLYAKQEGKDLIYVSNRDYNKMLNDDYVREKTSDYFGEQFISNYEADVVNMDELNLQEKQNWEWVLAKVKKLSLSWSKWAWYSNQTKWVIIKEHPNAEGITNFNPLEVQIVRKILSEQSRLFNVVIHEICHITSQALDGTLEFEQELTNTFFEILKLAEVN